VNDYVGGRVAVDVVAPPARRPPLWLLALLTFSGTLAMHIFVPALPLAATALGVGAGTIQMTVSVYILGLAIGQLVYGPLSDRFGRRVTLMAGLVLYTVSGLVAALAPSADALIAARLFQALGGCAGLVLGRAMVRDTDASREAATRLALMNLIVMVGPGLAPVVGGAMASTLGWRSIFVLLCALGVANFVMAWRILPETKELTPRLRSVSLSRSYWLLLRSPAFLGFSVGGGCATTSMYAFVASAPFIFVRQLHLPEFAVGPYLAVLILGVGLGSILASRLIAKISMRRLMVGANMASILAAVVLLGVVLLGHLTVAWAVGSMFAFTVGVGIASPTALTQAISVNPHIIGSASGLYGFTQMAVGALCTTLAGIGGNPALAAAIVLVAAGVVGQLSFWVALRWRGGGKGM
jgi:MFS transporter, DHA1 family, multidrug resistance protein